MWMKIETAKQGALSIKEAVTAWEKYWKEMSQERVQGGFHVLLSIPIQ